MLMSMTIPICRHCGRPVLTHAVYYGGMTCHAECTRGPMPADRPGCAPATQLTADDVRRIVREELAKLPPNALAQADAACGVSPGAMG